MQYRESFWSDINYSYAMIYYLACDMTYSDLQNEHSLHEEILFIFRGYVIFDMRDSDIVNESNKNFCNAWNRKLFLKSFETLCVSEPAVSSQSRVRWPRSCSSLIEWNERMVGLKKSAFNGVHAQYSRKGPWQGE